MLPLSLLRASSSLPMLVELKSGETYNGRLVNCDAWMNLNLRDVICTSKDGDQFFKLPECYIRGSSIKYLRLPEDALERVPEGDDERAHKMKRSEYTGGRSGRGGRGSGGGKEGGTGRGRGSGRGGTMGAARGGRGSGRGGARSGTN